MKKNPVYCYVTIFFFILLLTGCKSATSLSDQKVKNDLIGKEAIRRAGRTVWIFESISEITEFKIIDSKNYGDLTELTTEMVLTGIKAGGRYYLKALIVYRKESGDWKIVSISDLEYITNYNGPSLNE